MPKKDSTSDLINTLTEAMDSVSRAKSNGEINTIIKI